MQSAFLNPRAALTCDEGVRQVKYLKLSTGFVDDLDEATVGQLATSVQVELSQTAES